MKRITLLALLLSGCATTVPVAVVTPDGRVLKGSSTTSLSGGEFQAAGVGIECSGGFDPSTGSKSVSLALRCSDGRTGVGTAWRDTNRSGSGTVHMNDGTDAKFIFGSAANAL